MKWLKNFLPFSRFFSFFCSCHWLMSSWLLRYSYRMGVASPGITSEFQSGKRTNGQKEKPLSMFFLIMKAKPIPEILFIKHIISLTRNGHMAILSHTVSWKWIILSFSTSVIESGGGERDCIWVLCKPKYKVCHTDDYYAWRIKKSYYSSLGYETTL